MRQILKKQQTVPARPPSLPQTAALGFSGQSFEIWKFWNFKFQINKRSSRFSSSHFSLFHLSQQNGHPKLDAGFNKGLSTSYQRKFFHLCPLQRSKSQPEPLTQEKAPIDPPVGQIKVDLTYDTEEDILKDSDEDFTPHRRVNSF